MAANVMFHQLGRRRADRVFRQRFSIDIMGEEEIRIRRRYRFGKDSIKQTDRCPQNKDITYSLYGITST